MQLIDIAQTCALDGNRRRITLVFEMSGRANRVFSLQRLIELVGDECRAGAKFVVISIARVVTTDPGTTEVVIEVESQCPPEESEAEAFRIGEAVGLLLPFCHSASARGASWLLERARRTIRGRAAIEFMVRWLTSWLHDLRRDLNHCVEAAPRAALEREMRRVAERLGLLFRGPNGLAAR